MFVKTVYDRQPATETLVQSKYAIEVDTTDRAYGYTVESAFFYWEVESTLALFNDGDYIITVTDTVGIRELEPDGILGITPDPTGRVRFEIVLTDDR